MADDLSKRRTDPASICTKTTKYDAGRRSWVVSADQLKGAIQKVGNSAQAVEKELKR